MKSDLDLLAPEERRLLLVATDETYRRLTERIDWAAIGKLAAFRMISVAAPPLSFLPFVATTIGESLAESGYLAPTWTRALGAVEGLRRAPFRVGEIPLPHVAPGEAARRFRFDHGMPEDGAAYVLNPVRPDHYVKPAELGERLAREKLAAFLGLCGALGAREVLVTSGEVVDATARAAAGAPLPEIAGKLGLHATFRSAREVERAVVARFAEPTTRPHVPEQLRGWLAVDPLLEALARARIDHRLVEQACTLSFDRVIDVGAEACLALEGKGIDVGGRYRALAASRWSFLVTFWPE